MYLEQNSRTSHSFTASLFVEIVDIGYRLDSYCIRCIDLAVYENHVTHTTTGKSVSSHLSAGSVVRGLGLRVRVIRVNQRTTDYEPIYQVSLVDVQVMFQGIRRWLSFI